MRGKKMNLKKISTYIFLILSCLLTLFVGVLLIKAMSIKNSIEISGETNTAKRARSQKIDLSLKKEDFYTDTSEMIIFNLSPNRFLVLYNKNQMKIFERDDFGDFSDQFLSKRLTPFARLLWKYFELSRILKLSPLRIEKTMGKLLANNSDYSHDLVTYTNFCLGFLADQGLTEKSQK